MKHLLDDRLRIARAQLAATVLFVEQREIQLTPDEHRELNRIEDYIARIRRAEQASITSPGEIA